MNSCVLQGALADRDRFRNGGVQVSVTIREFHLNHLDVLHHATHSEIALAMDLHQNKTWHHRGILALTQNSQSLSAPGPPPSPRHLSAVDVNADSLLLCSDLRWRYCRAVLAIAS